MSFSDNLENNLKSLEAREERDPAAMLRDRQRGEQERREKQAAVPFAAELRSGPFGRDLLAQATRLGFLKRTKVYIAWIDTTLRLDAKNLRLELRPTSNGVTAHQFDSGIESAHQLIDLQGDPAQLAQNWLSKLES